MMISKAKKAPDGSVSSEDMKPPSLQYLNSIIEFWEMTQRMESSDCSDTNDSSFNNTPTAQDSPATSPVSCSKQQNRRKSVKMSLSKHDSKPKSNSPMTFESIPEARVNTSSSSPDISSGTTPKKDKNPLRISHSGQISVSPSSHSPQEKEKQEKHPPIGRCLSNPNNVNLIFAAAGKAGEDSKPGSSSEEQKGKKSSRGNSKARQSLRVDHGRKQQPATHSSDTCQSDDDVPPRPSMADSLDKRAPRFTSPRIMKLFFGSDKKRDKRGAERGSLTERALDSPERGGGSAGTGGSGGSGTRTRPERAKSVAVPPTVSDVTVRNRQHSVCVEPVDNARWQSVCLSLDFFLEARLPRDHPRVLAYVCQRTSVIGLPLVHCMPRGCRVPTLVLCAEESLSSADRLSRIVWTQLVGTNPYALSPSAAAALQGWHMSWPHTFPSSTTPQDVLSVLLHYLVLLPEPLATHALFHRFLSVLEAPDPSLQLAMLRTLVFALPFENRKVLEAVIFLVLRLVKALAVQGDVRLRDVCALFAPLLFEPPSFCAATRDSPLPVLLSFHKSAVCELLVLLVSSSRDIFTHLSADAEYSWQGGVRCLKAVSLPVLLEAAANPYELDASLLSTIITMHSYFDCSAVQLFDALAKFYKLASGLTHSESPRHSALMATTSPTGKPPPSWAMDMQLYLLGMLDLWLHASYSTLHADAAVWRTICAFIKASTAALSSLPACPHTHALQERLKALQLCTLSSKRVVDGAVYRAPHISPRSPRAQSMSLKTSPLLLLPEGPPQPAAMCRLESMEIAKQITLVDSELFCAVQRQELLHKAFTRPADSPNFVRVCNRFNALSRWSSSSVVSTVELDRRVDVLSKLITVAWLCRALGNFSASYAIVAGLQHTSVARLRGTWSRLPTLILDEFTDLTALFCVSANHIAYRRELRACSPPVVPYIGLYSKFLTALEEGKRSATPAGLINLEKARGITRIVAEVAHYQQNAHYPFTTNRDIQLFLDELPILPEEAIYQQSLLREPRKLAQSGKKTK